ncbi:MAG: hypothetical protein OEW21_00405 [Betaproteobacteria bacterium]|nr:hypothetical protein [Betaproteobacteria bacterium]
MFRSKWLNLIPPTLGSSAGYFAFGFTGMLLGPIVVAAGMFWWQQRRNAAEMGSEEARFQAFMTEAAKAPPVPAAAPGAAAAAARKPGLDEIRQRVAALEGGALADAWDAARKQQAPLDAYAAVEAALLAKRAARGKEQLAARMGAAAQAIKLCLAQGLAPMATAVFMEFIDERNTLQLEAAQWNTLGQVLLARSAYLEAAWTLHAGALLAGDAAMAQKRLVEVAGKAAEAMQPALACKLYETLLAKYPASQYAEFARASLRTEEKKLTKG